jgi:PAS domain S-box-containing protein
MQTSYKRFSVIAGFAVLLMVLLANGWVTRRQLGVQLTNQSRVQHTHDVLVELYATQSLLVDAETGQRGYLYTGDAKYLEPYNLAVGQVESHIDQYARLTADNAQEQADIPTLRSLVHAKLDELAQTISLYQAGRPDEAKTRVLSDKGLLLMNQIRGLVGEMSRQEAALQAARVEQYSHSVRRTVFCIYLASGLAALGLVLLAYSILREMELRERHGAELREREEWFRVTLTSIGDAVIATDEKGRVTFLNPIAEQLLGRSGSQAQGKLVEEIFPIFNESTGERVENPVKKVMELGLIVGLANHTVLERSDGTRTPIEDSAAPIRDSLNRIVGVVLVFRDATEARETQEIVHKSEKLAAAARFAATVAHEINNPLEAVCNLIYIAKGTPEMPAAGLELLVTAELELERVSHITRQTLGFFREPKAKQPVDLPGVVESVLRIYDNRIKNKQIRIEREFGECPPVHGLAGELTQVVSNLIANATDAVSKGGTIRVKLDCVEEAGDKMVQVSIADDGPGIEPQHRERIFEPFFTTKKDVGTGLGLWVTKEIVDRHGGRIEVDSASGNGANGIKGCVFSVLLPLSAGRALVNGLDRRGQNGAAGHV